MNPARDDGEVLARIMRHMHDAIKLVHFQTDVNNHNWTQNTLHTYNETCPQCIILSETGKAIFQFIGEKIDDRVSAH